MRKVKWRLGLVADSVFSSIRKATPSPARKVLRALGVSRLLRSLRSAYQDKYEVELVFQTRWAKLFNHNREKVLEYWEKYRFLSDIQSLCPMTEETRILDVGCGISTVLHYLEGKRFGIDPLADEYARVYQYPQDIQVICGRAENMPFPDQAFEVVFCSNALDHVTDYEKTLEEIQRVLKPGGTLALSVEIFPESIARNPAHPHCFTKDDVRSLLKGRFECLLERVSPWVGLDRYVVGREEPVHEELVMVLQRPSCVHR